MDKLIDFDNCEPEDFGFDINDPEFSWDDYHDAINFAKEFQYEVAEGFLKLEEDANGTTRVYST